MLRNCFIDGKLCEKGKSYTVKHEDAMYVINVGKAEVAKAARGGKKAAGEDDK